MKSRGIGDRQPVASALEQVADRARRRGGHEAASAAFARAAELSTDSEHHGRRLHAAAMPAWMAGQLDRARVCAEEARLHTDDLAVRADIDALRGRIAWNVGAPDCGQIVIRAALDLTAVNPVRALETAMLATSLVAITGELVDPVPVLRAVPAASLPDELVTSVRCLVQVADLVVVCTNRDGISHPWPGGRRQPGETIHAAAVREVHEETGWLVQETSLRQLGWLHVQYLRPLPSDHSSPHPDLCQIVLAGRASERTGGHAACWTDTDGYEISSQLMTTSDAWHAVSGDPASRTYLSLLST